MPTLSRLRPISSRLGITPRQNSEMLNWTARRLVRLRRSSTRASGQILANAQRVGRFGRRSAITFSGTIESVPMKVNTQGYDLVLDAKCQGRDVLNLYMPCPEPDRI